MPNRVIREGLLDSDKFNALNEKEQMFFVRIMLVADDYGCLDGRTEIIKSRCFPLSDIRLSDVGHMTDKLVSVGLIIRYVVQGKHYLFIPNFNQRLRIKRRKFPEPPGASDICQADDGQMPDTCQADDGLKGKDSEFEVEKKEKKAKFVPPSIEEVKAYIKESGITFVDSEYFHNYYTANGWKVSGRSMVDWKATVRNWNIRERKNRNIPPEAVIW